MVLDTENKDNNCQKTCILNEEYKNVWYNAYML